MRRACPYLRIGRGRPLSNPQYFRFSYSSYFYIHLLEDNMMIEVEHRYKSAGVVDGNLLNGLLVDQVDDLPSPVDARMFQQSSHA
jgi:hypothetical protein